MPGPKFPRIDISKFTKVPLQYDDGIPGEGNVLDPVSAGTGYRRAGVNRNFNAAPELGTRLPSVRLDNIGTKSKIDWKGSKIESTGKAIAPFASNIINSFRKPPKPAVPNLNSFTNLSKINLDDERNRTSRAISSADIAAERLLPSNTAAAVRANNLGAKLNQMSSISERESNANAGIANQQAQMDMQTGFSNTEKMDEYNNSMVERNLAQQREQSQNVANAGDKYVAIQNEKNKADVDMQKTQMMSHAFDQSQVLNSLRLKAQANGEADPLGRNYSDLANGVQRIDVFKSMVPKKYGGTIPTKRLY